MQINDYNSRVFINSTEIPDWVEWEVSDQLGMAQAQASVTLNRPYIPTKGDTLSIDEGFAGHFSRIINAKEIEIHTGTTAQRALVAAGSKITRKAPSKDIIFVNTAWLKRVLPYYYHKNGLLYFRDFEQDLKHDGVSVYRILFLAPYGIPGKEKKDHEFEIKLEEGITHHDIIKWLAEQCGLTVTINTPNLDVQKTLTIPSSATYFSMIPAMVAKWNPLIYIVGTRLYILDLGKSAVATSTKGNIVLTEDSFEIVSWAEEFDAEIIDHCVIRGPSSSFTFIGRSRNAFTRSVSSTDLAGEEVVLTTMEEIDDPSLYSNLEVKDFKTFTITEARAARIITTTTKKIDIFDPGKQVITSEETIAYNAANEEISKVTKTYEYADYDTPTRQVEEQYARIVKVGAGYNETTTGEIYQELPEYEFKLVEKTTTEYRDYSSDIGATEIEQTTESLCVGYKGYIKKDGEKKEYYELFMPITQAQQTGYPTYEERSKDGEGYTTKWCPSAKKIIRVDQSSPSFLLKRMTITTYFPHPVTRTYTEDIPIPNQRTTSMIERRWEYYKVGNTARLYDGTGSVPTGDFHPKVEIYEPDVVEESQAKAIAERLFKKRSVQNVRGEIVLTVPLPDLKLGYTITIPSCTKKYFNWTTKVWDNITIPGGTYWITKHVKTCQYSGDVGDAQRSLNVKDTLAFASHYGE